MKYSKRYIVFTIIIAITFLTNFYIYAMDNSTIERFRGASLDAKTWNPIVAADVNAGTIKELIDNKEYTSDEYDFFMDENRSIMVPVSIVRDALNCSAHIYDDSKLLVEKRTLSAEMMIDETSAKSGEDTVEITSPFTKKNGQYYVSLNDLSSLLGYSYNFDIETNTITAADEAENVSIVPASYDLRDRNRVADVRNQGTYGTCWAFAAISALESSLLPEEKEKFSVDNMTLDNSFEVTRNTGGAYTMGMAYLAAWQGPIYEKDDPYADNKINEDAQAVRHVQQMQVIAGKDYERIKEAVFKYGGVQTSLYSTLRSSQTYSPYFNRKTNAYCYIGTEKPNHDVVIVGWDDNYPASNFNVELEGDGAFICQNSWGENFGDDGFFYVSYYDTNIGTHNVVYTDVQPADNYDNIYQSDLCGWVGSIGMGINKESIYGANVFTAKNDEDLTAAAFYATAPDTSYEVYVVKNFKDESSLTQRTKVAAGQFDNAGYYTVDFDRAVEVSKGEKYAIVVYINTPGSNSPMAIEYNSGESYYASIDLEDGEGYISSNGRKFQNVKKDNNCNLCIKAFSNDR